MSSITNESKNNKSTSNETMGTDITWDEATGTWDEAERPWDFLGKPVTKETKNNKSLTNENEGS